MASDDGSHLRVRRYFPKVRDFDRDADGDVVWSSLKGPERLEAREQFVREKFIAVEEAKILRDRVKWCYRTQGVNHLENCKDIVSQYLARINAPNFGMMKGQSKHLY
mmetsp:Transcript_6027/g.10321  ORF Transcript_6027/g.10321 Transcript_6027/m.10321 type:complete len:107 (-) Transcript_6027:45-365(-)